MTRDTRREAPFGRISWGEDNTFVGAGGNNLKDRSAETVIRYNMIEGGNRQRDPVGLRRLAAFLWIQSFIQRLSQLS
jgi:hypothetical protein